MEKVKKLLINMCFKCFLSSHSIFYILRAEILLHAQLTMRSLQHALIYLNTFITS